MIKLYKLFLASLTLGTSLLFSTSALADTYQGDGYTVTIDGSGGNASYHGCDSQNRCLYIPQASNHNRGTYTWENSGYTYTMSPIGKSLLYRLRVYDRNNRIILNAVMSPAASQDLSGQFSNNQWAVVVQQEGNSYRYTGTDLSNGNEISLSGGRISGTSERRIYTWDNGGYLYQIAWRPNDPNTLRLQVFNPRGKELVDSVLNRVSN